MFLSSVGVDDNHQGNVVCTSMQCYVVSLRAAPFVLTNVVQEAPVKHAPITTELPCVANRLLQTTRTLCEGNKMDTLPLFLPNRATYTLTSL